MALGVDATLLYALGRLTPEPTGTELGLDTPYNTRLHAGLPPERARVVTARSFGRTATAGDGEERHATHELPRPAGARPTTGEPNPGAQSDDLSALSSRRRTGCSVSLTMGRLRGQAPGPPASRTGRRRGRRRFDRAGVGRRWLGLSRRVG